MSAETLRRAAAQMRERAADAFHDNSRDLWTAIPSLDPENEGWIVCEQRQPDVDWDTTVARLPYDYEGRVAQHIALWHPAVALAVADLLDRLADEWEGESACASQYGEALDLALLYLGENESFRPERGAE